MKRADRAWETTKLGADGSVRITQSASEPAVPHRVYAMHAPPGEARNWPSSGTVSRTASVKLVVLQGREVDASIEVFPK